MVELDSTAGLWLALLAPCALLTIWAVTMQTALHHASRARLRLCADGGLKSAEWVLRMLEEGARTPSLVLVLLLLGMGGSIACMLAVSLVTFAEVPWAA